MIKFKKLISSVTILAILGIGGVAFASGVKSPAELASELTGKTLAEVREERTTGKTYGTIAKEEGKLEEFKDQMLEQKQEALNQRVAEGTLTQEEADQVYTRIKDNQANCDGTGEARIGQENNAGFGKGHGMGHGQRDGQGRKQANGHGRGMGLGQGNCQNLNK